MANFFGINDAVRETRKLQWSDQNMSHSRCGGLWSSVFHEYFVRDQPFTVESERRISSDGERSDLAIVNLDSISVVLEVKAMQDAITWDNTKSQAFHYIKRLNKRGKSTIAIIARGDQFICWEQKGREHNCTLKRFIHPATGRLMPGSTPSSVVNSYLALHDYLMDIKARSLLGEFTECRSSINCDTNISIDISPWVTAERDSAFASWAGLTMVFEWFSHCI
jgi:hypothetical protein